MVKLIHNDSKPCMPVKSMILLQWNPHRGEYVVWCILRLHQTMGDKYRASFCHKIPPLIFRNAQEKSPNLDRHSLVALNVALSKRVWERRLWMMLNVLWLPSFVSVLPMLLWDKTLVFNSCSRGGVTRWQTTHFRTALFQNATSFS